MDSDSAVLLSLAVLLPPRRFRKPRTKEKGLLLLVLLVLALLLPVLGVLFELGDGNGGKTVSRCGCENV
jgi:uncharacterized membrane protein YqaE (UPF0057 family)